MAFFFSLSSLHNLSSLSYNQVMMGLLYRDPPTLLLHGLQTSWYQPSQALPNHVTLEVCSSSHPFLFFTLDCANIHIHLLSSRTSEYSFSTRLPLSKAGILLPSSKLSQSPLSPCSILDISLILWLWFCIPYFQFLLKTKAKPGLLQYAPHASNAQSLAHVSVSLLS